VKSLEKIFETFEFISENKTLVNEVLVNISSVKSNYPNLIFHDRTAKDSISKALLDDLQKAADLNDMKITIDFVKTGHGKKTKSGKMSRHNTNQAVDIDFVIVNNKKISVNPSNRVVIEKFTNTLENMGYKKNAEYSSEGKFPKSVLTFGFPDHNDHIHVSNLTDYSFDGDIEMEDEPVSKSTDKEDLDNQEKIDNIVKNLNLVQIIKDLPYLALKENLERIKSLLK